MLEPTLVDFGHAPGGRSAFSMEDRRRENHAGCIDRHFNGLLAFSVNHFSAFA
jgi:hypothetical protein